MIWIILTAFAVYMSYNFAVLKLFGIPNSLSQTYYEFKYLKSWLKVLFPIMMISVGGLLVPAWLEISGDSNFTFMVFLAIMGILLTGAAPAFNNSDFDDKIHTISAIFAAVFALLWIIFVTNLWWLIIVWTVIISAIAIITKTWKIAIVYWVETIAFMSTFTSIIAHFLL